MIGHRPVYDQDHKDFRASVPRFLDREIAPHFQAWEEAEIVDRDLWFKAGQAWMLCPQLPEEYGGTGDFRFNAVLIEECSYAGTPGPPATSLCTALCRCPGPAHLWGHVGDHARDYCEIPVNQR